MLSGEWPGDGCEYCQDIELSGGQSDRQFQLEIPDVYPRELDHDPTLVNVPPSILEVFFANTCNFKCVYCKGGLSSSIQAEEERWGGAIIATDHTRSSNQYQDLVPQFWSWMERNGSSLKRLQILGGEPLFQQDFYKLLDYFECHPNPALEFVIVTNLHIPDNRLQQANEKLSLLLDQGAIGRIDILVSVDCWGPGQEYVRNGFDRAVFEQNLNVLTRHQKFRIGLLSTVNALTIPEMPDLVRKFQEWNTWQPVFWYMHLVLPHDSSPFSPLIFDYSIFKDSLKQVARALPQQTWDDRQTYAIFTGIDSKIKALSRSDTVKQQELVRILDEVDRRRSLSWRETFPWLDREVRDVV